jgi:hypothetical protein
MVPQCCNLLSERSTLDGQSGNLIVLQLNRLLPVKQLALSRSLLQTEKRSVIHHRIF